MKRINILGCLLIASFGVGCKSQQKITQGNCDLTHEVEWTGSDMCAQEHDKQQHYSQPPVTISATGCKGIHIKHTDDFNLRLDRRSQPGTGQCPANSSDNPFDNKFPYDSNGKPKEFHTGKVADKNSIGCTYEVYFTPKVNPNSCDPHIAIGP